MQSRHLARFPHEKRAFLAHAYMRVRSFMV